MNGGTGQNMFEALEYASWKEYGEFTRRPSRRAAPAQQGRSFNIVTSRLPKGRFSHPKRISRGRKTLTTRYFAVVFKLTTKIELINLWDESGKERPEFENAMWKSASWWSAMTDHTKIQFSPPALQDGNVFSVGSYDSVIGWRSSPRLGCGAHVGAMR